MLNEEIKAILENHWHWIHQDVDGWSEMRANFASADLSYADLRRADLRGANLTGANLTGANLTGANLSWTHLKGANLSKANLRSANLVDTDFLCVDLTDADLTNADLTNATLRGANLTGAILTWPLRCPSHGAFIGWKKARSKNLKVTVTVIVKLYIPEDALRCSATSNKCRCNKARCLSAYLLNDDKKSDLPIGTEIVSCFNNGFVYTIGGWAIPDSFDPNRWNECSNGIHFFITEEEAINYRYF